MLATRLGLALGLPMPRVEAIDVSERLIQHSDALHIDLAGRYIPCESGKQLASLYTDQENAGLTHDYLPECLLETVVNIHDFARVVVLDKWTSNSDGRQAVFSRKNNRSRRHVATFIDQGYCFNAGEWNFPDSPLRGVYANNCVYKDVRGWDAFEPALSRAEQMDANEIWQLAADIPEEWYEFDSDGLRRVVEELYKRRAIIRDLISAFRTSSRDPFPNWTANQQAAIAC